VFSAKIKEMIRTYRNSKVKRVNRAEVPLQHVVAIIDSNASAASLKKRKDDAGKPLYLKRV